MINAWDDGSWIGNGGSRDATVDGIMVAGGSPHFSASGWFCGETDAPAGTNFINASFLHNPIFALDDLWSDNSRFMTTGGAECKEEKKQEEEEAKNEKQQLCVRFGDGTEYPALEWQCLAYEEFLRTGKVTNYSLDSRVVHGFGWQCLGEVGYTTETGDIRTFFFKAKNQE